MAGWSGTRLDTIDDLGAQLPGLSAGATKCLTIIL